jgi:hypothetical protein
LVNPLDGRLTSPSPVAALDHTPTPAAFDHDINETKEDEQCLTTT